MKCLFENKEIFSSKLIGIYHLESIVIGYFKSKNKRIILSFIFCTNITTLKNNIKKKTKTVIRIDKLVVEKLVDSISMDIVIRSLLILTMHRLVSPLN